MTTARPLIHRLVMHVIQETDLSWDIEFRNESGELLDPDVHTAAYDAIASRFKTAAQLRVDPELNGLVLTKTANYTMVAADRMVISSGVTTITLPSAITAGSGARKTVKREDGTNATTVASTAGTIDGASTVTLSANHQTLNVISDGANWFAV